MIKAITFDLGGVYFPNGKATFIKALEGLGVAEPEAKRVFLKSDEMNHRYKMGTMSDDEYWTWATKEWDLNLSPKELIDLLVDSYSVDEQVKNIVQSARKHGYKTLICTNNFPARINGLQERFGFLDDFDVVILSYEVGAVKPSEEIFKELVKQAGVPAQSIVFADDDEEAVAGASKVGITTFLYEGFDGFIQHLKLLGVELS
jgi:HAD superfamily hydrolase (TIGR01509 family)